MVPYMCFDASSQEKMARREGGQGPRNRRGLLRRPEAPGLIQSTILSPAWPPKGESLLGGKVMGKGGRRLAGKLCAGVQGFCLSFFPEKSPGGAIQVDLLQLAVHNCHYLLIYHKAGRGDAEVKGKRVGDAPASRRSRHRSKPGSWAGAKVATMKNGRLPSRVSPPRGDSAGGLDSGVR